MDEHAAARALHALSNPRNPRVTARRRQADDAGRAAAQSTKPTELVGRGDCGLVDGKGRLSTLSPRERQVVAALIAAEDTAR